MGDSFFPGGEGRHRVGVVGSYTNNNKPFASVGSTDRNPLQYIIRHIISNMNILLMPIWCPAHTPHVTRKHERA